MLEVDIFEQPRFCDEFSHLMNRLLLHLQVSTSSVFNMADVLDVLGVLLKCHIYARAFKQLFHQFTKSLK